MPLGSGLPGLLAELLIMYSCCLPGNNNDSLVVKEFHEALMRSPDMAVAVSAVKVRPPRLTSPAWVGSGIRQRDSGSGPPCRLTAPATGADNGDEEE